MSNPNLWPRTSINRAIAPTFQDFFTGPTDDWTDQNADDFGVDLTNDWMFAKLGAHDASGNQSTGIDMTGSAFSDTTWTVRLKIRPVATTSSGSNIWLYVGISDSISAASNTNQDFCGAIYEATSTKEIWGSDANGSSCSNENRATAALVDGTYYYWDIRRTGATTATNEMFNNSDFTSSVANSSNTVNSGTIGLRYLKFQHWDGTRTGNLETNTDWIKAWDGVLI